MDKLKRVLTNTFAGWFQLSRRFTPELLQAMTQAIAAGERQHHGELRFVVESRLSPGAVLRGLDARERALQLFSALRVWDTEHNSGVLIYLLMAERRIEVVADRGIAARVATGAWDALCRQMREAYAQGDWRDGSLRGIEQVHALLQLHFPAGTAAGDDYDELPNQPLLI
jgi:uncharacterized membrane protein